MLVSVPWVIRRRNLFDLSIRNDGKWNFEVLRYGSHLSTGPIYRLGNDTKNNVSARRAF